MRLLLAVLLALLLRPVMAGAAEPVEFWYGHSGAAGAVIERLCSHFNASHPGLRPLRCVAQGSYEQTLQKTVAAYRAGNSPALVEIYDVATLDMLLGGASMAVQQVMTEQHQQNAPHDFLPAVQRYYADRDGQLAAQPFAVSTAVLYSHRATLAAAGISEPPATWEAFDAALQALKRHGLTCPAVTDFNPWIWLEQSSAAMGVPVASAANGTEGLHARYRFDSGPHPRLLADLARWIAQGSLVNQAATRSGRQELAFAAGDCALLLSSTGAWNLLASGQVDDIVISPMPVYQGFPRQATVIGGAALWVLRGQSPEAYATVAAFLAYLRQPAVQISFSRQTGYLPVTQQAAALLLASQPADSAVAVGLASLRQADGQTSTPLRTGFLTRLRLIWTQELQNALARHSSTDVAVQQIVQRGNDLLTTFEETYRHAPTL